MKKILMFMMTVLVLVSCKKDDEDYAAQLAIDEAIIKEYLEENGLPAQRDPSGLYYHIIKQGDGGNFSPNASLRIYYDGYLLETGTRFERGTIDGPLNRYIQGWQIGIPKLSVGGKAILYIPSGLGYGVQGAPPSIPSNAVLRFQVEVIDVL